MAGHGSAERNGSRAPAARADRGVLEVIVPQPGAAVRWHAHGYPHPLARWHHHPEAEFHLIRSGTGHMMAGEALVPFGPGQVSLVGGGLPHNWLSDLGPGETLPERDIVCQVRPELLLTLAGRFPEAARISTVLDRARYGLVLSGNSARRAALLLEEMGGHSPMRRLADVIALLAVFAEAPPAEWATVVAPGYSPDLAPDTARRINITLDYVTSRLSGEILLEDVAGAVSMTPAAFSRFFHRTAGISFSDLVRRLRIARACHLLTYTDLPVSRIQGECGYGNSSNFNRRFRQEIGTTPSAYRRSRRG